MSELACKDKNCHKPKCGGDCANQGNQLNLAITRNSRRGINFKCPISFSFLIGYNIKKCVYLDKDHHHYGKEPVDPTKDAPEAPKDNAWQATSPKSGRISFTKACKDYSDLLGYRRKDCPPLKEHPHPRHHEQEVERHHIIEQEDNDNGEPVLLHTFMSNVEDTLMEPHSNTIDIQFGKKEGHPSETYISGKEAIYINGRPGAPIRLRVGETYVFNIGDSEEGQRFMLTDHPSGGPEATRCWHTPIAGGRITVEVSADFPRRCYYQSPKSPYVGGWVMVSGYTNDKTLRESMRPLPAPKVAPVEVSEPITVQAPELEHTEPLPGSSNANEYHKEEKELTDPVKIEHEATVE